LNVSAAPSQPEVADSSVELKHSDVILAWGNFNVLPETAITDYGVNIWAWGPSNNNGGIYERALNFGIDRISFHGHSFLTEKNSWSNAEKDDMACKDIEGNVMYPGWWPSLRWKCTNNPDYRAYIRSLKDEYKAAGANGIHLDDAYGVAMAVYAGGCFCEHCMKAFREFLDTNYTDTELSGMGIDDVSTFNYGDMVREKYPTVQQYRNN
jgi:hypothetical protein